MNQQKHRLIRRVLIAVFLFSLALQSAHSAPANQLPLPTNSDPCAKYLTSTPDQVIKMEAKKAFYKVTIDLPQTAAPVAQTVLTDDPPDGCGQRWVTQIVVPSTTSSGCPTGACADSAEIAAGAASFPGSSQYEEYFFRPRDSEGEAFCKSYKHWIAVYFKSLGPFQSAGSTPTFQLKRKLFYTGHWEGGSCHVKATYLGNPNWDTSEVYAPVEVPTTKDGLNFYRLVQYVVADGLYRDINVVIEFEKKKSN